MSFTLCASESKERKKFPPGSFVVFSRTSLHHTAVLAALWGRGGEQRGARGEGGEEGVPGGVRDRERA